MKKISIQTTTYGFALFLLCFLPATICSGQDGSSMQQNTYSVPEEKAQLWESLNNIARKDYDVCLEHCGYEQSCLDRCETAYENRLARDHKRLLNEKKSASDN